MAKITQPLGFYADVLKALEEIDAPYMIIGAFAASEYGSDRITRDVDMIVALSESHMDSLALLFPPPRYYADPDQMRNATADGTLFNIIDTERGEKVDLIPWTLDARYQEAFTRRIRLTFEDLNGDMVDAWYARPDDVIVGKLLAWDEGHSAKHQQDIFSMLLFLYQRRDPILLDYFDDKYIDRRARTISQETWKFWQDLKREAKRISRK
jgi:hypothetical protein